MTFPEQEAILTMSDIQQRVATSFATQGLMKTFAARLLSVEDGEVRIELPYSTALTQQSGYLHAGVVSSLVDNACGYAALTRAAEGRDVVTAEFKINFMRPATGDRFVAVGRVVTSGRQVSVCQGELRAFSGDSEKLIALMQATVMSVPV